MKPPPEPVAEVTIHIAAINDFHGAYGERTVPGDATTYAGGLPWLVGAMDSLRASHPDLLVIDGGDGFQGDLAVNATNGMATVQAFDLLGVDVAAVGNHEFDYGGAGGGDPKRGALEAAMRAAEDRYVSANIRMADGSPYQPEGLQPWRMIERNGVQIGIIGLTTTDTRSTTRGVNIDDLVFDDVVATVQAQAPKLREVGADVVIVAGHLTGSCKPVAYFEAGNCVPDGEIGRLLELPRGTVDVIVAGHAHTVLSGRFGDTFVLEDRSYGAAIGRLDLVVGPSGVDVDESRIYAPWGLTHAKTDPGCAGGAFPREPIDVGGRTIRPSEAAIALMEQIRSGAGDACAEVGCTADDLSRNSQHGSPAGDLSTDAMLALFPELDPDVALQNSGGLRADLPKGPLRYVDVASLMPFDNRAVLVEMSGEQLLSALRIGTSGAHGILQIAGGTYRYDLETHTFCSGTVGGSPIDPARTYKVVVNDFMAAGGDDLGPAFTGSKTLADGPLVRDAIAEFLKGAGDACYVDPPQPRIEVGSCPK